MLGNQVRVGAGLDPGLVLEVLDPAVAGVLGVGAAFAVVDGAVARLRLGLLDLDRNFDLLGLLDLGNLGSKPVEFLRLKQATKRSKANFTYSVMAQNSCRILQF